MKFIKKHKVALSVALVILILLIILCVVLYKILFSYGNNAYGNRLDNIKDLEISNYTVSKLESELKELEQVDSVSYRLNGKLISVIFHVETSLEKDTAKEYASKVLEYFSEEEKANYDIQVFVVGTTEEEESPYPIIGYKKAGKDGLTWSNN